MRRGPGPAGRRDGRSGRLCANKPMAMAAESVRKLALRHSNRPGNGVTCGPCREMGVAPGASPSGINPICCGDFENSVSAKTQTVRSHDAAHGRCGDGKAHDLDGRNPHRGEDDAADASAVVGQGQSGGSRADEPGRDDRVDGGCAHAAPAKAAQQVATNSCQGAVAIGPAADADGERQRAALLTPGKPKRRCRAGAGWLLPRRRPGNARSPPPTPTPAASHVLRGRMQKDRRAVEAHAPAEDGEHEGRPDDAPPVEARGLSGCRLSSRVCKLRLR